MSTTENLWAVAFDNPTAAKRAREIINSLQSVHCLQLDDVAIVTCSPDGRIHLDREPNRLIATTGGCGLIGFLMGLVVAQPLAGAAVGALVGGTLSALATASPGISDDFIGEVEEAMTPGSTVLFLMDGWGDREAVLNEFRGLGGKVLKTNVEPGWAREVQAALGGVPCLSQV